MSDNTEPISCFGCGDDITIADGYWKEINNNSINFCNIECSRGDIGKYLSFNLEYVGDEKNLPREKAVEIHLKGLTGMLYISKFDDGSTKLIIENTPNLEDDGDYLRKIMRGDNLSDDEKNIQKELNDAINKINSLK